MTTHKARVTTAGGLEPPVSGECEHLAGMENRGPLDHHGLKAHTPGKPPDPALALRVFGNRRTILTEILVPSLDDWSTSIRIFPLFLGLPHLPMEKRNVSLARNVAEKRRPYSTYYTKSARRLVEEIYATDLDLLGYEFEDETRTSVLVPLYDMDQLRQQRGEVEKRRIKRSIGEMGFRHLIRICLVTKKTIRRFLPRVLIDAIRKNIVLNDRGPMRGGR